jgi:hypothetical protein
MKSIEQVQKKPRRVRHSSGFLEVAPAGIEPASRVPETLILSIELRSQKKRCAWGAPSGICGDTGIRTPDLLHAMQAL